MDPIIPFSALAMCNNVTSHNHSFAMVELFLSIDNKDIKFIEGNIKGQPVVFSV